MVGMDSKKYIISTTFLWGIPKLINLWCKWLLSGLKGDLLLIILEKITVTMSNKGTNIINSGGNKRYKILCVTTFELINCMPEVILAMDMFNPKKYDPPSPIRIFDG